MATSDRRHLESQLHDRLNAASARNLRAISRFAGGNGLVLSDLRALMQLKAAEDEGAAHLTPGDLAKFLELSSGAVTYLVERLSRAGLVVSERDQDDRRRARVLLTAEGTQVVARLTSGLHGVEVLALTTISDTDLAAAVRVLELLDSALDSYAGRFSN